MEQLTPHIQGYLEYGEIFLYIQGYLEYGTGETPYTRH